MIYVFADCKLDDRLFTVLRDGKKQRIRPKVFQVLVYLLQHRERVVSKQELTEQLWSEQFISDSTLEGTIRDIRHVLGDSGRQQHIIQTLSGRGYRFIAHPLAQYEDEEPLQAPPPLSLPPEPPLPSPLVPEPEHRQLTVLSCDLADVITLTELLPVHDMQQIVRAYKETCFQVIRHFDGRGADVSGTQISASFGYPLANEDDARRAVYAGLDIVKHMQDLNRQFLQNKTAQLAVRIGIHTGPVVVGAADAGQGTEAFFFDNASPIAEQIRRCTPPDSVLISDATARLVEGYFVAEACETALADTVVRQLYRILAPLETPGRLEVLSPDRLTPFIGRQAELALLLERWSQTQENMGQVVLVSGEAGIGKSRLVQAMKDHLSLDDVILLESRCSPYHQHSALYPVIDLVQRFLQWQQSETPLEQLRSLETLLARYNHPLEVIVPLFAALLSLSLPDDRYPPLYLSPQQLRQKTLEFLLALVLGFTAVKPVLLLIEDLHWVDPSTLELLSLLLEHLPAMPICIVCTYRPHFSVSWSPRSYMTPITLRRLPHQQVDQIISGVAHGKALPQEVLQQIIAKTDGVPLFIEECTKTILESGCLQESAGHYALMAPLPNVTIPMTLQDSLMARLDRLEAAKGVAQLGSVVGRQFSYALIHAVWQEDEALLHHALARLVEAELVYQRGLFPQTAYVFKHALVQETAYQSLLKNTRQQYHKRIADVLLSQLSETETLQPELLAHHYTEAGLNEQAIAYWQQAGERAVERSASVEAISHFMKGLGLLKTLPETPEHLQQSLNLHLAMGAPLLMLKGHSAHEVEDTYNRAYELCQKVGDSPQRFRALAGLWGFYLNCAQHNKTQEIDKQCFHLAQRLQDASLRQEAYLILGTTSLFLGEWSTSYAHFEQGIALYNADQRHSPTFSRGLDPGVVCLSRGAWALWMIGYPDQALIMAQKAYTLAQHLAHIYSIGFALHYLAILHQCRREVALVEKQAAAVQQVGHEQGFVQWLAAAMCMQGWALAEQGCIANGIRQLQAGMASWHSIGTELAHTHMLLRLAEAYKKGNDFAAGLQTIEAALGIVQQTSECYYEAELYRLKGELLLAQISGKDDTSTQHSTTASHTEAESCFLQAIEIAQRQGARALELRAVMSFLQLWKRQLDRREESYKMLHRVYSGFTEGFDTPDLQEAKALLEELA